MAKSMLPYIHGTKSSAKLNQLLTSTGISALDVLLGGGIPVGTICVIEEEEFNGFSNYFADCFASEGVICAHDIYATTVSNSENYFQKLPAPVFEKGSESVKTVENDVLDQDAAIAWRYKNLSVVDSSIDSNLAQAHYFNRKKCVDVSLLQNCRLHSSLLIPSQENWDTVVDDLQIILKEDAYNNIDSASGSKKNLLRIIFSDFGSPLWGGSTSKLLKFLYRLKCFVRNRNAVAILTVSSKLFNEATIRRIRHYSDAVFRMQPLKREKPIVFDNFDGLLRIEKLPTLNSLNFSVPDCLDLAFKFKKGKLVIEKLHTPPDFSESTSSSSALSCSSSVSRAKLDF